MSLRDTVWHADSADQKEYADTHGKTRKSQQKLDSAKSTSHTYHANFYT